MLCVAMATVCICEIDGLYLGQSWLLLFESVDEHSFHLCLLSQGEMVRTLQSNMVICDYVYKGPNRVPRYAQLLSVLLLTCIIPIISKQNKRS